MENEKVLAFYGEMGAGKTTLIKAICTEFGVTDNISSPTFSIVNEYKGRNGKKTYHFDFYRIKSQDEAYDLGYEEYFYSGAICLIEWPEKVKDLLPLEITKVVITKGEGESRTITY
jgi:tRNA threonylcarbamoyladenosine biosynthesis protein TsaE